MMRTLGLVAVVVVSVVTFPAVIVMVLFGLIGELIHRAEVGE